MKKALLLAIVLLIVSIAFADVVIGTGTSVQYYPMSTLYNYYRSASLYTAAEINAAGTITDLKWYCSTVNNTTSFPIKIYMKHSTAASLAGDTWVNHVSDATEVFSATLAINAVGWFNFDITDFEYNGTDNLIVLVDSGSAAYVSPYVQWRYTTTVENMFAREDSDGSAPSSLVSSLYRPNITFVGITTVAPPAPSAIVSPSNNAENVSAGATLNWLASNLATSYKLNFGTDNPPTNIVSGVDLGNVFTYDPTGDLSYSQLYYWQVVPTNTYGDASDCPVWSFTTMADPTIVVFPWTESFDGTTFAPVGWSNVKTAGTGNPGIWDRQTSGSSPNASPHSGAAMARYNGFNLSNGTKGELVTPPMAIPNGEGYRLKFWMFRDGSGSGSYPNEVVNVYLNTSPTSSGATLLGTIHRYYGYSPIEEVANSWYEYTFPFDGIAESQYVVFEAVSNYGYNMFIDDVTVEVVPDVPTLSHSPTSIAFPLTKAGENSVAQYVTVTNTGGSVLTLTSDDISMDGSTGDFDFSTVNFPANLSASQSVTIPVFFTPQSAGDFTATLLINYESVNYEVALSGTAYPDNFVFEGFEGSFPPAGWADPGSWSKSAYTYYEGTGSAYKSGSSSSQFILSTPKLEINTGDNLLFMGRVTSTTSAIDIIYSQDRTSWTVLETLTAPTSSVWLPVALDLTPIVGTKATGNYYIGFRTMGSASYYIDNVVMPPFALEAPEAVTLSAPADAATGVGILPTLSWTVAPAGGVPTSYDIYLEANDNISADPAILLANVSASPYTLTTALDYSTTYIWKVVAKNAVGDAPASAIRSFTTMADPTQPFPYSQDFNGGTSLTTIGWSGAMSITTGHGSTSNVLYRNLYSGTPTTNAVTPPIGPMATDAELMFDYRYVNFSSPYPGTVLGAGDNLQIQVSTDNGATFTTIHTIDQSNHITSGSLATVTVELDAYSTGSIMLKFLANWGAGDYYLDIDNVFVRVTPTNPTFAIDPTVKNYGVVNLGASSSQIFTITNMGAGTLIIDNEAVTLEGENADEFSLSPIAEDINLSAGQTAQITVTFTPTTEGLKQAQLQIVDNTPSGKMGMKSGSRATQIVDLSGEGYDATVSSFPWAENFENASFPPVGWTTADLDGGGSYWTATTSYNHTTSGSKSAEHTYSSATPDQDGWLVSPPLTLPADKDMVLSFWNYNQYPSDMVYNGVLINSVADPNDLGWVELWSADSPSQSWTQEQISITAYAGQTIFLAFVYQGYNADAWYVDDLEVYESYDYPEDTPITVGEGEDAVTVTVSGGSANNVPGGEIPDIPNGTFVSAGSFVLELLGAGPWTVTIETDAPWGAYYKGGSWVAVENVGGFITFEIEASKDLTAPIILGSEDPTLPVTLSSFTAVLTADMHVNLQWVAETEVDHAGYNVLRSEVNELSTAICINTSMIDEGQNVGTQVRYNFLDKEVYHNAIYYYWLENVDLNGETEYYGPITVYVNADGEGPGIPEIPIETKLFAAFPNPFNPATNLRYSMKEAGDVRIDIYNVKGQILKTYHNSHNQPGYYQANWDGRDLNGRPVSTGVYFYRMTSGKYSSTKKMVMAK